MIKWISAFLLFLLSIFFIAIFYLSTIGIETNSFNNLIRNKLKNYNEDVDLKFSKAKLLLDIKSLNLKIKLINPKIESKKKEEEAKNMESTKSDIGWGHQIRSYILHPYRLVKDNRTNHESSNPDKVLDGEIDEFLESSLYKLKN